MLMREEQGWKTRIVLFTVYVIFIDGLDLWPLCFLLSKERRIPAKTNHFIEPLGVNQKIS